MHYYPKENLSKQKGSLLNNAKFGNRSKYIADKKCKQTFTEVSQMDNKMTK